MVVWLRGAERLLIVCGAILAIYLGYLLYDHGIDKGAAEFRWDKFVINGQGPGLILVACGMVVLIMAIKQTASSKVEHAPSGEIDTVVTLAKLDKPPHEEPPGQKQP